MPSIFSRKSKVITSPAPPPLATSHAAPPLPQQQPTSIDEYGRLLPLSSVVPPAGTGSPAGSPIDGRARKDSKGGKSGRWGGKRERRGTGGSAEGVQERGSERERERDRDRSLSGPPKVQFAPAKTARYSDLPTTPTRNTGPDSATSSQTARDMPFPPPQPILRHPSRSRTIPGDSSREGDPPSPSDANKYTFLSTRFPLIGRTDPEPYLETTVISSRGARSGSGRYPNVPSGGTLGIPSAVKPGGGGNLAMSGSWVGVIKEDARRYGFLAVEVGLVVGLHEMIGAVEVCVQELTARGLTTPLLFSSRALDLSFHRITLLIQSYVRTLTHARPNTSGSRSNSGGDQQTTTRGGNTATATWKRDMQLASPNEVAWFLRWLLGRAVRIKLEQVAKGGDGVESGAGSRGRRVVVEEHPEWVEREERGLLEWEDYEIWRGRERGSEYDKTYFEAFLRSLPPSLTYIIRPLFALFSHFAAYSHESGMTPGATSSLLGPLLFGCGPPSCNFDEAHAAFVRSAGATEHLILSHIRSQAAAHDRLKGQFPINLTNWVKGYPRMLITDRELDLGLPRKGLRVLKVERARRTVRAYSPDLCRSGQTWATEMLRERNETWPAWQRTAMPRGAPRQKSPFLPQVTDDTQRDAPLLTEHHQKRLNLDSPVLPPRLMSSTLSSSTLSSDTSVGTLSVETPHLERSESDVFASTVDRDWRMFEGKGFDDGGLVVNKLNFDLLESVRRDTLSDKRRTMTWDDFAAPAGGFSRNAGGLDATLTLGTPTLNRLRPSDEPEISHRKLKKSLKEPQPNFQGWDTCPALVPPGEGIDVIEEAFVEVAVDLLLSNGWTEYQELTHRPANWVLMEYRAMPGQALNRGDSRGDPRTSSKVFLFEEFVPANYQRELIAPEPRRGGFFSRNRASKKTSNESAASGRTVRTRDEAEFDAAMRRGMETRLLALSKPVSYVGMGGPDRLSSSHPSAMNRRSGPGAASSSPAGEGATIIPAPGRSGLMDRFSGRRIRSRTEAADERVLDETIETRTTSGESSTEGGHGKKVLKPEADKWIDILVASGAKRMDTQVAEPRSRQYRKAGPLLTRSASAASLGQKRLASPDATVPLAPYDGPSGDTMSPALRRHGSEKSSLRQPMFASTLALDKISPPLEGQDSNLDIEPSRPEATHPEQYAYAYSPESARAVPEMQAVRDRSTSVEKVLRPDAFHHAAGSFHSQSALEILNVAVGGGDSVSHGSQEDVSRPSTSPNRSQTDASPHRNEQVVREAPPVLGPPLPISPKPLPVPQNVADRAEPPALPPADDKSETNSRRDTVHSIMDRYGSRSPYGGHERSNSEDLPPLPAMPPPASRALPFRPGFMRPAVPSQYESFGSRDSYASIEGDLPALPSTVVDEDEGSTCRSTGPAGGIYDAGMFAREEYEYGDSPVDPAYAPSQTRNDRLTDSLGLAAGSGRTKFQGGPWTNGESRGRLEQPLPPPPADDVTRFDESAFLQPRRFETNNSGPGNVPGRVTTLASRFENAGRVPPGRKQEKSRDADVSEYRTALEEPDSGSDHLSPTRNGGGSLCPIPERYHFEPPPTLADIEAIARRPSPGRVEHGLNLGFVPEEEEEYEETDDREDYATGGRQTPILEGRRSEDALGLRDASAREVGVGDDGGEPVGRSWQVEKMDTPERKLRRR